MKRTLFVGPTGTGKSTLINILFNNDVNKESMSKPALATDTSSGVTSFFTTYYNLPDYAYTDSIGFGDNRFSDDETFNGLKAIIRQSMVGYNRVYLCIKYGRLSNEIRHYIDFLITIFGEKIMDYCTIIFTHCNVQNMTKELYLEKNKQDADLCHRVCMASNVIFGENNSDEDEQMEEVLIVRRRKFLDQLKNDIDNSSQTQYLPTPGDFREWVNRIWQFFIERLAERYSKVAFAARTISLLMDTVNEVHDQKENYRDYYGECPICLNSMWTNDTKFTRCHHCFHTACLNQWAQTNDTCPTCREIMDRRQ